MPGGYVAQNLDDSKLIEENLKVVTNKKCTAEEIEEKRIDWLQAGVRLLWIVYPETRSVHVYRPSGDPSILGIDGELNGEELLPNFTCKVSELFEDV